MKESEVVKKLKEKLAELNPILQLDGGGVEFIDYQDGILFVKLGGHCIECMGQEATMAGLLNHVQEEVPEVKKIINVPL